ncbi:MAG TPA: hypothetical protein VF502_00565 [Stellaceae bacterium]
MPRLAVAALSVAALLAGAAEAVAQSCGREIERFARQYDLSTETPRSGATEAPSAPASPPAASSGTTTAERHAQSGGVTSPPDVAAPTAIQPPRSDPDRTPLAPDAAPSPPVAAAPDGGKLTAADRAGMESLLQAAQAAERQGREEECLQDLRAAEAMPGAPAAK